MEKDKRALVINRLINGNDITEFSQIFDHFPKTPLSLELGIRYQRLNNMIADVNEIMVGDIYAFSQLFDVPPEVFFRIIMNSKKRPRR